VGFLAFRGDPPPPPISDDIFISGFKTLKYLRVKQAAVTYNEIVAKKPPFGWFGEEEYKWLYTIGRHCPGPLLEQGPFAGLSTTAFTAGVRDADQIDGIKKMFISTDIFPMTPKNDKSEMGYPHYWKYHDGKGGIADLYVDSKYVGSAGEMGPERDKLLEQGLMPSMVGALNKNGLLPWVHVVVGSTYPNLKYGAAFFDTAHGIVEVVDRLPSWVATAEMAGDAPIIMSFHDHAGGPSCRDIIKEVFDIRDAETFDQTWAVEVHGLQPEYKKVLAALPSTADMTKKVYDSGGSLDVQSGEAQRVCNIVSTTMGKNLECAAGFEG